MRQEISFGKLKLTNNKGANNNNTQVNYKITIFSTHCLKRELSCQVEELWMENIRDMHELHVVYQFCFYLGGGGAKNKHLADILMLQSDVLKL